MTKQDQYECAILVEFGEMLRSNAHLAYQDAKKLLGQRVADRMEKNPSETTAWFKAWCNFVSVFKNQKQVEHLQV